MPDEQLQLKLELETEKAKRDATEALSDIEEEVKSLAETFTDVSTKLESVADSFSVLKTRSASDLQNVSKSVKTSAEEFDKLTDTQTRGTQKMGVAGKVMGAVWKDMSAGVGAVKSRVSELVGLRGLALGGVGVTGGLVATLIGSFLTIDKIDTAIKNLSFDAQGLRGQLLGLKETRAGDTFESMKHHVAELHEQFHGLGHKGAVEVMSSFARTGIEVKTLNDSTRNLTVSFDTILGLPVGTTMSEWSATSKEFGQDINFVADSMVDLYGDFSSFIEQGRKGAVTITDLMNSLEMAGRSLSGWRTNWQEMIDLQLLYIEGAEKAGMSTEGAATSFGSLANSLANLSSEKWGFILQNMEGAGKGATGEMKESVDRVKALYKEETKAMGGGFYGKVEAARSMAVKLSESKDAKQGDISTWYGMITEGMQAKGLEGKGLQMEWLQTQMGMSRGVSKAITEMGDFYKKEKEGPLTKEDTEKRNKLLERIGKEQMEDRMTASERITAGITRWWMRVAPSIFGMIIGSVDLIVKAISFASGKGTLADVKESKDFLFGKLKNIAEVSAEELKNMGDIGKDVMSMKDIFPPSYYRDEERAKISEGEEYIEKLPLPDESGWKRAGGQNKRQSWKNRDEEVMSFDMAAGTTTMVRGKELLIRLTRGMIQQLLAGGPDEVSK